MTSKLTIAKVGGGEIELTGFAGLKGAPMLDRNDNLVELGHRFANGEASQGTFKLLDPVGELPRTDFEYNLPAHKLVTWTEDASGDEIWLSRGRVSTYDGGRGFALAADQVEYDATVDDGNVELRGQAFTEPWDRPDETGWARLVALQAYTLNGAASTATNHRDSCEVTVSDSHLAPNTNTVTMPAKTYPAGTQPQEVVTECADTEGKVYGVVIHHATASHLCLLYIVEGDHTTYVSPIKISDQIAEWDPTDLTAPVFEPHWEMGKATVYDGQQLLSGLVSTYGTDQSVFSEHADNITDYDYWVDHFGDSESETATQAIQINESERTYRQLTHVTHRVSIIILPEQAHLVTAGMSLQIKATAAIAGQYLGTYQTRRIAEHSFRPRSDGRYWADLNLDRVIRRRAYRAGAGKADVLPGQFDPTCDTGDCTESFARLDDSGWGTSEILGLAWTPDGSGSTIPSHGRAYLPPLNGSSDSNQQILDFTALTLPVEILMSVELLAPVAGMVGGSGTNRLDVEVDVRADLAAVGNGLWRWNITGIDNDDAGTQIGMISGIKFGGGVSTDSFLIPGVFSNPGRLWVVMRCEEEYIRLKTWWHGTSEPLEWTQEHTIGQVYSDPRYLVFTNRTTDDDLGGDVWVNSICFRAGASCSDGFCGCGPEAGQFATHIFVGNGDGSATSFGIPYASGYIPGSLGVDVDGLDQNVIETNAASGLFDLEFAPEADEVVHASWRVP